MPETVLISHRDKARQLGIRRHTLTRWVEKEIISPPEKVIVNGACTRKLYARHTKPIREPIRHGITRPSRARKLSGSRELYVCFPPDMAEYLADRAQAEQTTFSEQVRRYVEWGRESYEQALMQEAAE